jgi:hypothetical protein
MVAVNDPKVIVVHKDSPYQTLQDLVNDIKSRPGKVKMSYTGPGGSGHVQALIYNKMGLDMALTAYPGGCRLHCSRSWQDRLSFTIPITQRCDRIIWKAGISNCWESLHSRGWRHSRSPDAR